MFLWPVPSCTFVYLQLQLFALFLGRQQGPKLALNFQGRRNARLSVPQQGGGHQGTPEHPQSGPR